MQSLIFKRSVVVAGHKTSVSLEEPFWSALKEIASDQYVTVPELVAEIDANRQHANLSSALRLFVLGFYRDQIADQANQKRMVALGGNAAAPPSDPACRVLSDLVFVGHVDSHEPRGPGPKRS